MWQCVFGSPRDPVLGACEGLQAVFGGRGAVHIPGGGVQDGLDHGLGSVEVLGGDPDSGLDELERGGVGGHLVGLGQRGLAWDREASGLAGLADRGRDGGGSIRIGFDGTGREGKKKDKGDKEDAGHGNYKKCGWL
ncbi:hypothetical protein F2P56_001557, partial [Juglans regia]